MGTLVALGTLSESFVTTERLEREITMRPQSILHHALSLGVTTATALLLATPAEAKGPSPAHACLASFSGAEEQARSGRLREAQEQFSKCAKASCGTLQKKCAAGAERASADLAHVAIVVNDSAGQPLVDVLVKMDGEPLATRLDGRALPMDPGVHEFTFGARVGQPGRYVWLTRKIMVVEGQREPISVTLPAPADAAADANADATSDAKPADEPSKSDDSTRAAKPADEPTREVASTEVSPAAPARRGGSALPWILGGVGVLGLGAGALFTYWGRNDNDALAQCAPECSPSSVTHIRQLYLASDISFAAGGAALAVSTILFVTSHPHEAPPGAGARASGSHTAYVFDVQPTRSGAFATVGGSF